jgi:hypothetical protein
MWINQLAMSLRDLAMEQWRFAAEPRKLTSGARQAGRGDFKAVPGRRETDPCFG